MDSEIEEKIKMLNESIPNWREIIYDNGQRMFSNNGTMLDEKGNRSIFDDVDE